MTSLFRIRNLVSVLGALLWVATAEAYTPNQGRTQVAANEVPAEFKDVGITENLGDKLDLSLEFINSKGEKVKLGDYFSKGKPVVISLVYYACPGLCNFHLNGFVDTLKEMDWRIGEEFEYVVISFDPKEGSELAGPKKANYIKSYGDETAAKGWHFLTGSKESVDAITQATGFRYKWVEQSNEWAHASAAMIATPDGTLSRYLYGIMFNEKDVKLALNEAGQGKVGGIVDRLILYCFQFDPAKNQYTFYAFNAMKAGGGLTVVLLALWLIPAWIRQRRA